MRETSRSVGALTDDEWLALMNDFADLVLARHRVSGSLAGVYSLYAVLDDEREKAQRPNDQGRRRMPTDPGAV